MLIIVVCQILDPDDALDRLERNQYLYYHGEELDISDDRYILDLYPAERYIASAANLRCAEYLFVKRTFFKDYYIVRTATTPARLWPRAC
jgi:hypothetical protein